MRSIHRIILLGALLPFMLHADKRVTTIIIPQSAAVDAARELAGWENFVNTEEDAATYGVFSINPTYQLSFRPERIVQCFFGDAMLDYKNTFTVAGSRAERFDAHWLADYFGLPPDFASYISFCPEISNALIDVDMFMGLAKHIPGLYLRAHAPIVSTRWRLGMCETLLSTGSQAYDPGYVNAEGIPRSQLMDGFIQFITGHDTPQAAGVRFNRLEHARMSDKKERLTNIADIHISLGWNILQKKKYHLGINLRMVAPTGNRPTGNLLFEPIVGNGHHWELGGGISSHVLLWQDEDTESHAGLYLDLNITHLFASTQCRSFDLCAGHNSRYMLAQRMGIPIADNLRGIVDGEQTTPTFQYQNELTTVANLTTLPITVSVGIQTDLALLLNFSDTQNSWGFGYGFWGKSSDCITIRGLTPFDTEQWALKGDAQVFGFEDDAGQQAVALSATQSTATIRAGKNFPRSGAVTAVQVANGKKNPAIDNPALAVADSDDNGSFVSLLTEADGSNQINTSIQPILLTTDDIDIESARTKSIAHKIFSHYTRTLRIKSFLPYIGFGAEISFGPQAYCPTAICLKEPESVNTALSYWSIWFKGGVAF